MTNEWDDRPDSQSTAQAGLPRWLESATRHSASAPIATLIWAGVIAAICAVIGFRFLPLAASRAELIDPSADFQRRWLAYTEEFGELSEIVVVISGDEVDDVGQAAGEIETALRASTDVVDVLGEVDWTELESRALQYADLEQLRTLQHQLESEIVPAATGGAGLAPTASRLTADLQAASDAGDPNAWTAAIAATTRFAETSDRLLDGNVDQAVWESPTTPRSFPQPNVFSDGRVRIVTCFPANAGGLNGPAVSVQGVREIVDRFRGSFPNLRFGVTGVPVLEFDEMTQSSHDMAIASAVSAIGVSLVLVFGFRGRRVPTLAVLTLLYAMAWSVGWAAVSVGSLNILSVSFAAILIGLGVDFSLHWLAHSADAEQQLNTEASRESVAVTAASHCGTGIATAAVTTATAFLVAGVTPFRGLSELGVIAGGGVILCAIAALIVTPALASSMPARQDRRAGTPRYAYRVADLSVRKPLALLIFGLVVAAAFASAGFDIPNGMKPAIGYQSNLLKMQPQDLPAIVVQRELEEATSGGLLFGVSRASSPDEARTLQEQLQALPEVGKAWSLGQLIPAIDDESRRAIDQISQTLSLKFSDRAAPAGRDDTVTALQTLAETVSLSQSSDATALNEKLQRQIDALQSSDASNARQVLDAAAKAMAAQAVVAINRLKLLADRTPVDAALIPAALRRRFVGQAGTWLVVSFPAEPVWEEQPLTNFVEAVRSIDTEVTGTPIQNLEATRQIQSSYLDACAYALVAVALILFVDASTVANLLLVIAGGTAIAVFAYSTGLGRLWNDVGGGWAIAFLAGATFAAAIFDVRGAARAFGAALPSLLGAAVTVGSLVTLNIDFNPANLIVLPLILGIGVDDGVHILHGLRSNRGKLPAATIHALTMTSLTSAIGFGSLAMAAHRGLASLGVTLVVGVTACYFVSIFVLLPLAYLLRHAKHRPDAASRHSKQTHDFEQQDLSIADQRNVG